MQPPAELYGNVRHQDAESTGGNATAGARLKPRGPKHTPQLGESGAGHFGMKGVCAETA
jgi:hypothetical protein